MAQTTAENIRLTGGRLCLDFVNTVSARHKEDGVNYLHHYADLVAWSQHAGILSEERARQLLAEADRHPQAANATFEEAIELREALHRVFYATVEAVAPPPPDLETVNLGLALAMAHARLIPAADGYIWGWRESGNALDQMLWPIVRSAAELLTSDDLGLVRECQSETGCGWLFVDISKNHRRRWCSMDDCGNTAKVRRFRTRQKAA